MDRDLTSSESLLLAATEYLDRHLGPISPALGVALLFPANSCYSDREGTPWRAESPAHALGLAALLAGFATIGLSLAAMMLRAGDAHQPVRP